VFTPIPRAEFDELAQWLMADTWPFHGRPNPTPDTVNVERFWGEDIESFWIDGRAGVVRLFDLADETPLFDLRLRTADRGRGLGTAALRELVRHVFLHHPTATRIGGYTRHDNVAMRKTFQRCGFVKEAHYRKAWFGYDTIGYGILRGDYESGATTPVDWAG